jgi:alpha-L-arabinofuranosidase
MKRFSALVLVLALSGHGSLPSAAAQTSAATIKVDYVETGLTDRRTFGTNHLFWVDNDRALANGALAQRLRGLGVGMLRFPGGEAADNYDWRQTPLTIRRSSRASRQRPARRLRTNYQEFLTFSQAVGATPNSS